MKQTVISQQVYLWNATYPCTNTNTNSQFLVLSSLAGVGKGEGELSHTTVCLDWSHRQSVHALITHIWTLTWDYDDACRDVIINLSTSVVILSTTFHCPPYLLPPSVLLFLSLITSDLRTYSHWLQQARTMGRFVDIHTFCCAYTCTYFTLCTQC